MAIQHVDEYTEGAVQPESLWKRALMMIGFMVALRMGQTIVHLIPSLQFVKLSVSKRPSNTLSEFGASLATWMRDVAAYQCMAIDKKTIPLAGLAG